MSDDQSQPEEQLSEPVAGETRSDLEEVTVNETYDVSTEAQEALRRFEAEQKRDTATSSQTGVFAENMLLQIEIANVPEPVHLLIKAEAIIGRRDPASDYAPDLDLTPHAGYRLGVSRRHAIIRREGQTLNVIDLGSRNGSYLNGDKLEANTPQKLRDGDRLQIGKIMMRLAFHEKTD